MTHLKEENKLAKTSLKNHTSDLLDKDLKKKLSTKS